MKFTGDYQDQRKTNDEVIFSGVSATDYDALAVIGGSVWYERSSMGKSRITKLLETSS